MTLEEFITATADRLPSAEELTAVCAELGIGFSLDKEGKPVLKPTSANRAEAEMIAQLLQREPWRSRVVEATLSLPALLKALEERGLKLEWQNGGPAVIGPTRLKVPALMEALRAHKPAIVEMLRPKDVPDPAKERVRVVELAEPRHGAAVRQMLDEWETWQEEPLQRLAKFRKERPRAILGLQWFDGGKWLAPYVSNLPEGVELLS